MNDKLWAGRFTKGVDRQVLEYTETTLVDMRLLKSDIWGSIAHVIMLHLQEINDRDTTVKILESLISLDRKVNEGELALDKEFEDVHLNIERLVIGNTSMEVGGRMHTARSRNDQVVTDTRMYLREAVIEVSELLTEFVDSLLELAKKHTDSLAIGYTHVQPAQPISYAFWLTCYASMYLRDLERLRNVYGVINQNVLGSCALSGTTFDIDRDLTKNLLGFDKILEHSLDGTSSRDFTIQTLSDFSLIMCNHSKLCEEIVLWSTNEFALLEIDDAFATGSSIMPQKKNAVVAELMKGKTGRVYGALTQMLVTAKGVTTGYNCDLQEDKPLLWDAIDQVSSSTSILKEHLVTSRYDSDRALELCWKNFSTATELANYLVEKKSLPFREAHRITGEIVGKLSEEKMDLSNTKKVGQLLKDNQVEIDEPTLIDLLDPKATFRRQISVGGTGANSVQAMINKLELENTAAKKFLSVKKEKIRNAYKTSISCAEKIISGEIDKGNAKNIIKGVE